MCIAAAEPSLVGCFRAASVVELGGAATDASVSLRSCAVSVHAAGVEFLAVQAGVLCFAVADVSDATGLGVSSGCNVACADSPHLSCGGAAAYSLYRLGWVLPPPPPAPPSPPPASGADMPHATRVQRQAHTCIDRMSRLLGPDRYCRHFVFSWWGMMAPCSHQTPRLNLRVAVVYRSVGCYAPTRPAYELQDYVAAFVDAAMTNMLCAQLALPFLSFSDGFFATVGGDGECHCGHCLDKVYRAGAGLQCMHAEESLAVCIRSNTNSMRLQSIHVRLNPCLLKTTRAARLHREQQHRSSHQVLGFHQSSVAVRADGCVPNSVCRRLVSNMRYVSMHIHILCFGEDLCASAVSSMHAVNADMGHEGNQLATIHGNPRGNDSYEVFEITQSLPSPALPASPPAPDNPPPPGLAADEFPWAQCQRWIGRHVYTLTADGQQASIWPGYLQLHFILRFAGGPGSFPLGKISFDIGEWQFFQGVGSISPRCSRP
eukprot:180525-Chlamydomonas_euryale.AAC.3